MKLLEQSIPAKDVLRMIDNRLRAVEQNYTTAVVERDEKSIKSIAETKWQIAELKMQLLELLTDQVEESLNKAGDDE